MRQIPISRPEDFTFPKMRLWIINCPNTARLLKGVYYLYLWCHLYCTRWYYYCC